ncbi:MAG: glycosyltransferase family 4 protein, partial [Oscillospiraceae bacterium]|nr:glycosyltransferase family 4 protein [Oscillospiraceae bacterium]
MNFIIFSAQYLPTVGGVERYTNSLAKELIKNGHNVSVVTSALSSVPMTETDADGIQIFRLPCLMLMNGRFPVIKPSAEKTAFEKWFTHNKPDFCVIQTRFYINSIYAAHLCSKHNVPSLVIDHSTSHLMGGGLIGKIGDMYEHFAANYIKKHTQGFYGVSKQCANWLKHFGINNAGVLYNCANLEAIEKIPSASKSDYGCTDNETLIVFAARLIPEKGVLKLIDAFNALPQNTNTKLVVAGTGALYEDVKQLENDRIKVLGALPFEQVIGLYKAADVFCLPTDYPEGFPTTVLEAAACKAMLVATDKGCTAEVISDD